MAFTKISSIIKKKVVQLLFLEWNPCFRILLPEKLSKRNAVQAITLVFQLSEPVHTGIEKKQNVDQAIKVLNLFLKIWLLKFCVACPFLFPPSLDFYLFSSILCSTQSRNTSIKNFSFLILFHFSSAFRLEKW